MADVKKLIRWEDTDPQAIFDQLAEWVRWAKENNEPSGIAACFIRQTPDGNVYDVCSTKLPVEVIAWAGQAIINKAHES